MSKEDQQKIVDFVRDHKEHFDSYPFEVEVGDIVYSYEEYWEIINKNKVNI